MAAAISSRRMRMRMMIALFFAAAAFLMCFIGGVWCSRDVKATNPGYHRTPAVELAASLVVAGGSSSTTKNVQSCQTDDECKGTLHCDGMEKCYNHVCDCLCCA